MHTKHDNPLLILDKHEIMVISICNFTCISPRSFTCQCHKPNLNSFIWFLSSLLLLHITEKFKMLRLILPWWDAGVWVISAFMRDVYLFFILLISVMATFSGVFYNGQTLGDPHDGYLFTFILFHDPILTLCKRDKSAFKKLKKIKITTFIIMITFSKIS